MLVEYLIIEATSHCNSRCPHCPRHDRNGYLDSNLTLLHLTPKILKNLNSISLRNLQQVIFEGDKGDPCMNPYLPELINFFKSVPEIYVYTNGGIQSATWWADLAAFTNLKVVWSIDGLEDTNSLYRVNVSFKKVMDNAASFISAGGKAFWKCLLFKHNQHQIADIIALSKTMGFKDVQFRTADISRFNGETEWDVKFNGKHMHYISPSSFSNVDIIRAGAKLERYHQGGTISDTSKLCPWSQRRQIYINYLGQVIPCCMMHYETMNNYPGKDKFLELVGGSFENISLYNHNLDNILTSNFFINLEHSLENKNTMHPVCVKSCYP